jgi:formyl-CoA transferase
VEEIQRSCDENGVPVSRIMSMADVFTDPHYAARGMLAEVDDPKLGRIRLPGVVPKFSATPGAVRTPGRAMGQDNHEVYGELGLSEAEIARLDEEGVI